MEIPKMQLRERFALRRSHQGTIAVLASLLAAIWLTQWVARGGWSGRLAPIQESSDKSLDFILQVDVNRAEWPELAALPRIGETLAKRIIDVRRRNGPFDSIDDLQRVRGIGGKTVEQIRPFAIVRPSSEPSQSSQVKSADMHASPEHLDSARDARNSLP